MATLHPFRKPPHRHAARESWGEAARGLGPILVALPLAAFSAIYLTGGPPAADAAAPGGGGADNIRKHFARCSGPVRTNCVVDGDTIWLNGDKIRIADIDTPEISEPSCAAEARLGERATERLAELLNRAPFAVLPNPDGRDEDFYGRKLRVIARDGQSLGQMLVAEGLAHEWGGPQRHWC